MTLATNDSYALGALVLASSLKRTNTARKIVVMVTPEGLSPPMKSQLNSAFDEVVDVSLLDSKDKVNLSLMERPELGVTFTKLHCWRLVQYTKCVFLDADTMVSIMYIYSRGVNRRSGVFKGQLISECPFGVKTSSKKPTKFLPYFCPCL